MLRRHIQGAHGLTPEQYRARWNYHPITRSPPCLFRAAINLGEGVGLGEGKGAKTARSEATDSLSSLNDDRQNTATRGELAKPAKSEPTSRADDRRFAPQRRMGDRVSWAGRLGSFLRDLNDGIHAEIRIGSASIASGSPISGRGNSSPL